MYNKGNSANGEGFPIFKVHTALHVLVSTQNSRFNTFRELLQLRCRTSTEGNKSKKKQTYRTMSEATQRVNKVVLYGGPYLQTQQTILETQHNIFGTQVNFVKHNTKLSKHNTKLSKHNTKLPKHITKLSYWWTTRVSLGTRA